MELGRISAIFRYPVKSMAGELLDVANLGWHGIEGDRRMAFRRLNDISGFPWLTASKLPQLILYKPFGLDANTPDRLPTHVCTPDGKEYELRSEELRQEIWRRLGFMGIDGDHRVQVVQSREDEQICKITARLSRS